MGEIEKIHGDQTRRLQRARVKNNNAEKPDADIKYAKCPNCGLVANNADAVRASFGFRSHDGKQVVQSLCMNCRKSNKILN